MIHLEHLQVGVGIAQGEGVEARPQHHHLAHAPDHGGGDAVLGEAAARGHEQARRGLTGTAGQGEDEGLGLRAQDGVGEGVGEHASAIDGLVRGAVSGGGQGGAAGLSHRRLLVGRAPAQARAATHGATPVGGPVIAEIRTGLFRDAGSAGT